MSPKMSALEFQGLLSIGKPTIERPSPNSCYWDEQKTPILRKKRTVGNNLRVAKVTLPAAYVILAGPVVSCLPLGSLAPILSILATSFASSYSDSQIMGIAVVLIQGCGLCGFEGRILALLSFLSFSSTFDKLHASSKGLYSDFESVPSSFAGPLLSACSAFLGIFQAIAFAVRGPCVNEFMLSLRLFGISWNKRPSLRTLTSPLGLLVQTLDDCDSSNPRQDIPSNIFQEKYARYPSTRRIHESSPEHLLEDWKTDKERDEAQKESCLNDMERRNQALFDEVKHLIDGCNGLLRPEEWDKIIVALN